MHHRKKNCVRYTAFQDVCPNPSVSKTACQQIIKLCIVLKGLVESGDVLDGVLQLL